MSARTAVLTAIAMTAFAANSILCRLALSQPSVDPASFTTIRMFSGAAMLCLILSARGRGAFARIRFDWGAGLALFFYMLCFSLAYVSLSAGAGALILFGAVQLTMFSFALTRGERFSGLSWAGLALAFAGLVYLVSPGLSAPAPAGALLMGAAGAAWGVYSLRGRGAHDPLAATAGNFLLAAPLALGASLASLGGLKLSAMGALLAAVSGAGASGCGYVIWYAALRGLSGVRAASVQLSVPVIAALAASALLSEPVTLRLALASAATLGGVAIVLTQRARASVRVSA